MYLYSWICLKLFIYFYNYKVAAVQICTSICGLVFQPKSKVLLSTDPIWKAQNGIPTEEIPSKERICGRETEQVVCGKRIIHRNRTNISSQEETITCTVYSMMIHKQILNPSTVLMSKRYKTSMYR